jgi:sugar phosphate isomerase/epimerase
MRVEYASSALLKQDISEKIETAQRFCEGQDWEFGIQIHNTSTARFIQKIAATGVPLSFHAPLCSEYFINLANKDRSFAWQSLQETVDTMQGLPGNVAVFHGFLMTDEPVLCFNKDRGYDECMSRAYQPELSLPGSYLCKDFFAGKEYGQRLARVQQRLEEVHREFPGIQWCIENDYPAYGSGLLLAEHMCTMNYRCCLDVSHLWVASLLFNVDFWQQVEMVAEANRIACVHFHANTITSRTPVRDYRDGHRSLRTPCQMRLDQAARILYNAGVEHWVIETPEADLADLQLLADWLDK